MLRRKDSSPKDIKDMILNLNEIHILEDFLNKYRTRFFSKRRDDEDDQHLEKYIITDIIQRLGRRLTAAIEEIEKNTRQSRSSLNIPRQQSSTVRPLRF